MLGVETGAVSVIAAPWIGDPNRLAIMPTQFEQFSVPCSELLVDQRLQTACVERLSSCVGLYCSRSLICYALCANSTRFIFCSV